jgi:hypothetical protein
MRRHEHGQVVEEGSVQTDHEHPVPGCRVRASRAARGVIHVPVFMHVVLLEFYTGDPPGNTPALSWLRNS